MKGVFAAVAFAFLAGSCAEDTPPAAEVQEHFHNELGDRPVPGMAGPQTPYTQPEAPFAQTPREP